MENTSWSSCGSFWWAGCLSTEQWTQLQSCLFSLSFCFCSLKYKCELPDTKNCLIAQKSKLLLKTVLIAVIQDRLTNLSAPLKKGTGNSSHLRPPWIHVDVLIQFGPPVPPASLTEAQLVQSLAFEAEIPKLLLPRTHTCETVFMWLFWSPVVVLFF